MFGLIIMNREDGIINMEKTMLTHNTNQVGRFIPPWAFWDNICSPEQMAEIEKYFSTLKLNDSIIFADENQNIISKDEIRKSKSALVDRSQENSWIFDILRNVSAHANNEFFNFDLLGFDYIQYAEYHGDGGHYRYHTDLVYGAMPDNMPFPRKLSFSLILSDPSEYTGGEFWFKSGDDTGGKAEQPKGRLIVFPSWVLHKVTPVTSGVRKSLVWWVNGPKFK
jgi:PKHD-type hydroxylase